MEVNHVHNQISLNQNQYIQQKLEEFSDFLHPSIKRSIPLVPNFQKLLIAADDSTDTDPKFPCWFINVFSY